jgi:hypothetical protein
MLHAAMRPIFVAHRDNRLARAQRVRAFFRESVWDRFESARAAQVRVRERCTTAAPKRVTSTTKPVTTQRTNCFCNRRRFASGSSQQPKISFNAAAKTS